MDNMKDYCTSVTINLWIIEILLNKGGCDRLGTFITFNLVKHPNEAISAFRVSDWFKHVITLLGYHHEHIRSIDHGEMAECWLYIGNSWDTVRVGHKYWSLKKCQLCIDLLKSLCEFHGIPIEYCRQEK